MREPQPTTDSANSADAAFEADLLAWLRDDVGFDEYRRVVQVTPEEVQLSKFAPGFLKALFESMTLLPELFDGQRAAEAYARQSALALVEGTAPAATRVATWAAAAHTQLREAGARHGIPEATLHEVRVGIDSVEAILDDMLRARPRVGDAFVPGPREVGAYREMLATLRDDQVFERYYGTFRGHAVRDYCPAMPHAYRMLEAAWCASTGALPPV